MLGVSIVRGTEQILLDSLLKRRPLQLNHHYRCSCGKATLLLPMCLECSKLEISELEGEDPTEVDIPDEPQILAFAQQTGCVLHLTKEQLAILILYAQTHKRAGTWYRQGELWCHGK